MAICLFNGEEKLLMKPNGLQTDIERSYKKVPFVAVCEVPWLMFQGG